MSRNQELVEGRSGATGHGGGEQSEDQTFEGGGDTTTHGEQEEDMDGEEFLGEQGDIGASFSDDMFEEESDLAFSFWENRGILGHHSRTTCLKKQESDLALQEGCRDSRRLKVEETLQLMGSKKKIWMVRSFW